jgi:hypothetical protein
VDNVIVAVRVPPPVRQILIEHAEDTERTLSDEMRLWLQFAAASVVFTTLHQPGIEESAEVIKARRESREDMHRYMLELLPHAVVMPPVADTAALAAML